MKRIIKPKLALLIIGVIMLAAVGARYHDANALPEQWGPKIGDKWPSISMIDQTGRKFTIDEYRGEVIIIEPIGMNCPACQAFSGAHQVGSFESVVPQGGLKSFAEYFPEYTNGLSLSDPRLVFIQLLLYDMKMGPTKPRDAEIWAKHFGGKMPPNHFVAVPTEDLRGTISYNLIPGFQLLDKNLILRYDATGHQPRHSTWTDLLPAVRNILGELK